MAQESNVVREEVTIQMTDEPASVQGALTIPKGTKGIVVFAHGSGSGRFSPRNQQVASTLVQHGLATLLMDLLTPEEEEIDEITRQYRFDIPMLARRLVGVRKWLSKQESTRQLKVGYFGSSTGAAAALIAAAAENDKISAVVSRGGRVDLAEAVIDKVRAPSLFLVGGHDTAVLGLNQEIFELLPEPKKLEIVPRATHLFEEPGALEEVARSAAVWFKKYCS